MAGARSSAGDPGAFYVFLSDGTLLIASSHGTPMIGSWKQEKESVLTMVEEGIPHRVEVLNFARNKGRNAFCAELPRWLAVRHASSDARTAGEIWVALLTVTDWDAYRPDVPGYCAGGLYAPEAGNG